MQVLPLKEISSVNELEELLLQSEQVRLYGDGYYFSLFMDALGRINASYREKIACVMVTVAEGKPAAVQGIPLLPYNEAELKPGDCVLLTLGSRFTEEIYNQLKDTGVQIIQLDFNMFQEKPYLEVKESIQSLLDRYPEGLSGLNMPVVGRRSVTAWTCWWQGEEAAPEIVKACWESQRRNLPPGVKHVIVTRENYRDYLTLPEHIAEGAAAGAISLVTLSDIARSALLYRYGGFWLDATLLVVEPFKAEMMDYPIYTRNLSEVQYCTDTMWATWFLYAKPGNELFLFLMESFFEYFSRHDKLKYYFTFDYMIAVACNTFPDIRRQMKAIPYNNEGGAKLIKHLQERYSKEKYEFYIRGTSVQKLTYKLSAAEKAAGCDTIYNYLLRHYTKAE